MFEFRYTAGIWKFMRVPADSILALVVDDEAPARRRLVELLSADPDFAPVRVAENGIEAIAAIESARPDIVFLDVQMPGVDGFGVMEAIGPEHMPLTVFVTAYDRFAIQAFELNAVDYLLKPFSDRRCQATIARLKQRLAAGDQQTPNAAGLTAEMLGLVSQRFKPGRLWQWVAIKEKDNTRLLMVDDIEWVEASGVYVTLHSRGAQYLYRASLGAILDRLDPFRFVRIHRSYIVNVAAIDCLQRRSHGEFEVRMRCGAQLAMSRTYRDGVESVLGQTL